ncbi:hypothetical protein [Desulfosporosinus fructosivorans]|uniref:hypothetical protein n=1 Tax=Desulfosporosinus fructosivorans TaxID=2018669 RepID=UPI001A7E2B76|nr:hypothetical protein [Desulfosporosinus fructosivorans]
MVVKQEHVICVCGRRVDFPEGQIRTSCQCGSNWEIATEGFWSVAINLYPIVSKIKLNHYEKYMAWRNANPKWWRKAGAR